MKFKNIGATFLAGVIMTASFIALTQLPSLRGSYVPTFLFYYLIAGAAYAFSIYRLAKDNISLKTIWGFAIIFNLIFLFSVPSLSDDVYRYVWDGHLLNKGVNPYLLPVNSPLLDSFDTSLRSLVNHNWMASPYLPVSQFIFAVVSFLAPQSILAFQVTAVIFSLLTGWLILDLLNLLGLPLNRILLYLWNPLVVIEFSHGAHIDSLMIFLMMAAYWLLIRSSREESYSRQQFFIYGSVIVLATATLTKLLPVLLVPIFLFRWGWKGLLLFIGFTLGTLTLFANGAGWGLAGPLDGTGIFGAFRIYLQWWKFNSGIYHWLDGFISGNQSQGFVGIDIENDTPKILAKAITFSFLGLAVLASSFKAWQTKKDDLMLLRLSIIPLGTYLLFAATVHPWYLTLIIPILPFLMPRKDEPDFYHIFIWSWIYFSIAVAFSYLTYYDPEKLREHTWVRLVEYVPVYLILAWAFLSQIKKCKKPHQMTV